MPNCGRRALAQVWAAEAQRSSLPVIPFVSASYAFPEVMGVTRWSALGFGALAGAMLTFPAQAAQAARQGAALWAGAVAPVLGPYMVCMLMLTSRVPCGPWARAALCWLCGSPGGAKLMQPLALRGREALRFAALSGTMSPLFFLSTVSAWLGDARWGRIILLCHFAGALLLALCIPAGPGGKKAAVAPVPLGSALKETALALGTVALCMMLGCAAAEMAACALPGLSPAAGALAQCCLEVTAGVRAVIALNAPHTPALVCAACSFGGLSLLMQNAAFWQDSGVSLSRLFLLRACHALLSGGLCLILTRMIY